MGTYKPVWPRSLWSFVKRTCSWLSWRQTWDGWCHPSPPWCCSMDRAERVGCQSLTLNSFCVLMPPAPRLLREGPHHITTPAGSWRTHFVFAEYWGVVHDSVCVSCVPGNHHNPKVPNDHLHLKKPKKGREREEVAFGETLTLNPYQATS